MKKRKNIEDTVIEMVHKRIERNPRCSISVRGLARAVARETGLIRRDERPEREIYCVVDTILQELGGEIWTNSRGGTPHNATRRKVRSKFASRVYSFGQEVAVHG